MNNSPRRAVDLIMGLIVAAIGLMVLGQVMLQVLMQYMFQMIIAATIVVIVWLVLRAVIIRRMW